MKGKALMTAGLCTLVVALAQAGFRPASARATQRSALARTIIKVETHQSIFKLSAKTAPRGVVIFKVINTASFRHDFSIKGRTTRALAQGESETLRIAFLRPGRYTYRDTIDHHASWGLKGVFTIT
jgi:plastocyanin